MEQYIVSARKYRPSTFASVVGQPALTETLKNAIAGNRLAHAYLFCGSRGVGKTSCARIFAKTINCEHPTADGEACNNCDSCRAFNEGRSLNIVELDAASNNSVEDIRSMIEQVQMPPTQGRYRVFIVDEVHMLSSAAFNAFLKTLEEPPSYIIFILATTEKHKIIPTILSRCQIFDFNRITIRDIVGHLKYVADQEGIKAETPALAVIASKADGAMRDALSIFDQVAASSQNNITYQSAIANLNVLDHAYFKRLIDAFLSDNVPEALTIYKEIRDKGFDSQFFVNGLALYFRDLMLAKTPQTVKLLEIPDEMRAEMQELAGRCDIGFIYKAMDLCNDTDLNFRQASNKQFLVELLLIKLCQQAGPSPINDSDGEGQLREITAVAPAAPTVRPEQKPAEQSKAQVTSAATTTAPSPATPVAPRPIGPQTPNEPPRTSPAMFSSMPKTGARPKLRTPDLSLRPDTVRPTAPVADKAQEKRAEAYTDDAVAAFWESYMQSHSSAHLLVNTMRNSVPVQISGDNYSIYVENDIQLNIINDNLQDITRHMRDKLRNDNFALTAMIGEGLSSPKTWTEREVLNYMKDNNPGFGDFIDEFNLTLL